MGCYEGRPAGVVLRTVSLDHTAGSDERGDHILNIIIMDI